MSAPDADRGRLIDSWIERLGISRRAAELYADADVIDLHLDSFIWHRLFGYDLHASHSRSWLGRAFFGHADFPRVLAAGLRGATWVITTNPWRTARGRQLALLRNIDRLRAQVEAHSELAIAHNAADYDAARSRGKHAVFLGIQGGNALELDLDVLSDPRLRWLVRVTIVHLTSSRLGATSSPLGGGSTGLTDAGKRQVEQLRNNRVLVDLAHIHRRGFFEALEAHGSSQPVLVTHTGVSGVHPLWRNIDDEQLRAVARTGGVVGIMYHSTFLGDPMFGGRASTIVDHIAHAVKVMGEDHVALGSDFDGAIVPPKDLPNCLHLPLLSELMLARGLSEAAVRKILGGNFLRVVRQVRG